MKLMTSRRDEEQPEPPTPAVAAGCCPECGQRIKPKGGPFTPSQLMAIHPELNTPGPVYPPDLVAMGVELDRLRAATRDALELWARVKDRAKSDSDEVSYLDGEWRRAEEEFYAFQVKYREREAQHVAEERAALTAADAIVAEAARAAQVAVEEQRIAELRRRFGRR